MPRALGLLSELLPSLSGPSEHISIREVVGKLDPSCAPSVLSYLKAGEYIFDVLGVTTDPLKDNRHSISGGPSLMSDGYWVWRLDLRYFVENYLVELSQEFVDQAGRGFPPGLNRANVRKNWKTLIGVHGW